MHFCFNALESSCSIRHVQTFLCFKGINGLLHTSSISLLIVSLLWCIKMIRHRSRTHDDLYTRNLTVINITNFRFLINNDICDVDNIVIVTTVFSGNRSDILNVQKKSDRYSTLQKKLHRYDFFYMSTYTFMSNLVRDQEFRGKRRDQVKIISQKYFWLNTVCQEVLG